MSQHAEGQRIGMSMSKDKNTEVTKQDNYQVKVTVFTPTYNRRHTIERLYQSLQAQTFKDFEWLIVDDGSTDDTASLISRWIQEESSFPIRYYWKQNGGKHTAHNYALTKARGEYLAIQDSDDWYSPEALEVLITQWNSIPPEIRGQYSNIEGKCKYEDGKIIGHLFPQDLYDSNNFEIQRLQDRPGDTMGMYRLDVLKEFPFPDNFIGCFVPESLVWNRIADKYKTRFLNAIIGYKEYLADGLTKRSIKAVLEKSAPAVLYYKELSHRKSLPLYDRIKSKINVYRYSFHNSLSVLHPLKNERITASGLVFIISGYLMYLKDRITIIKERLSN
jgi:glycosyltransferase involved in cell wall biosynthesis